ncbi:MAG: PIG-L deacetylase family protein [Acidobacteriota bacterium]
MKGITRREMLGRSSLAAVGLGAGLPASAEIEKPARKLNIVVAGAHPDDPETGCGGTIALYAAQGHTVTIVYLTRGEAGIPGKTHAEAAQIRTAEAEKACAILKAKPVFAGQIDGDTKIDGERYAEFRKLLEAEKPDIVFTHWPVDTHRDHRAASLLTYDAWLAGGRAFDLYYFEVDQGEQTQNFHPTHYVNIGTTLQQKHDACFAHASQRPATDFWPLHSQMQEFRGIECGVKYAEAFIAECQNHETTVPVKA